MLPSKAAFTAERPFDIAAARRYLHAREEGRRQSRFALWQQARADAERIIDMVIARFNPSRIIQWGSVLEPRHFSAISDIDLAIEGVGSLEFLTLFRLAEAETKFPLDVVRWENLEPEFQRVILMKGEIRYRRLISSSNSERTGH
ncbi:nucleotidyltransferase family protein [Thiorhodovibrio winogradskyi]|nr:hypothetical protein [Thiorhodovibrio winogradskyi]